MEAVATPCAEKPLFSNKALKKLIFPLVIEQFLAISVGFCDTVMISGLGDEAISGVSLVDMIMTLMINVFAALATGGAVVAAQFIGANAFQPQQNRSAKLKIHRLFLLFSSGPESPSAGAPQSRRWRRRWKGSGFWRLESAGCGSFDPGELR